MKYFQFVHAKSYQSIIPMQAAVVMNWIWYPNYFKIYIPYPLQVSYFMIFCFFFIQRAANTGGGPQDRSSRWGHEKFEGFSWGKNDSSSRATGSGRVALEGNPNQSDRREEKRSIRHDHREKPREDHGRREDKRSRRHSDNNEFEARSREDHYRRDEKRPKRHESESYLREDQDRRGGDKSSTGRGDSSSHRHRERWSTHKSSRWECYKNLWWSFTSWVHIMCRLFRLPICINY